MNDFDTHASVLCRLVDDDSFFYYFGWDFVSFMNEWLLLSLTQWIAQIVDDLRDSCHLESTATMHVHV